MGPPEMEGAGDPRLEAKKKILQEIMEYASGGQAEDLKSRYAPPPALEDEPVDEPGDGDPSGDPSGEEPDLEALLQNPELLKQLLGE